MAVRLKTETIAVTCPHCGKEYDLEVAPKPGKMGDYSIECPRVQEAVYERVARRDCLRADA
jgi:hypothetical protein